MAEEPEQVLPQQRATAASGIEEVRAEVAVELQQHAGERQRWQRKDDGEGCDEDIPYEQR